MDHFRAFLVLILLKFAKLITNLLQKFDFKSFSLFPNKIHHHFSFVYFEDALRIFQKFFLLLFFLFWQLGLFWKLIFFLELFIHLNLLKSVLNAVISLSQPQDYLKKHRLEFHRYLNTVKIFDRVKSNFNANLRNFIHLKNFRFSFKVLCSFILFFFNFRFLEFSKVI